MNLQRAEAEALRAKAYLEEAIHTLGRLRGLEEPSEEGIRQAFASLDLVITNCEASQNSLREVPIDPEPWEPINEPGYEEVNRSSIDWYVDGNQLIGVNAWEGNTYTSEDPIELAFRISGPETQVVVAVRVSDTDQAMVVKREVEE